MKDFFAILSFAKQYFKKHLPQFVLVSIFGVFHYFIAIAIPFIQGSFINTLSVDSTTAFLFTFAIIFLAVKVLQIGMGYLFRTVGQTFITYVSYHIMEDVVTNIQDTSLSVSGLEAKAEITSRINNDAVSLVMFLINFIMNFFGNVLSFTIPVIYLATVNLYFCVIAVLVVPIYLFVGRMLKNKMFKTQKDHLDAWDVVVAQLFAQLFDIKFIKLNNIGQQLSSKLFNAKMNLLKAFKREFSVEFISDSIERLFAAIMQAGLFIYGGLLIIRGDMAVGTFVIIYTYFNTISGAAGYFLQVQSQIQGAKVYVERLTNLKAWQTETNGGKVISDIHRVDIKNLSFSYGETQVIKQMNLCFEKGKIYSVLGDNGKGKSTLTNLLLGLYIDEFQGEVLYDNTTIKEIDMKTARGHIIGVTQQEPPLLNESIRFNILFKDDNTTRDEEIYALAKMLGLSEYLNGLENGLDTVISESASNLSGGQKQKISILRSLLKNPKLMVLDEPSSALDSDSKQQFIDYLRSLKADRIIIIVTHDSDFLTITDCTVQL